MRQETGGDLRGFAFLIGAIPVVNYCGTTPDDLRVASSDRLLSPASIPLVRSLRQQRISAGDLAFQSWKSCESCPDILGGTEMIQVFKASRGACAEGCFFRVEGRGLEVLKDYI